MSESIYPEELRRSETTLDEIAVLRKALFVKKITLYLVALLVAMVLGGGLWLTYQSNSTLNSIRDTQVTNTGVAKDTHALIRYVSDCQNPQGRCHLEQLRQQANILGQVDGQNRKVSAAAASCSLGVPQGLSEQRRYHLIKHCIETRLGQ